ncbi:hypothetical protein SAMN02583745_02735 [Thorsellia anophelis DSM 18579]|uniref:Uncharacterized protein n=1 Tax=Thorsellia anophelis DSM 18579 TaxID=1123402 RepID=A0A1I0FE80_9GAMM|nr:hypothetical protein SAMN02583745_02735 [Thorsellia anophelis DSM 18579]
MRLNYVRARTCINVIRGLLSEFGYHATQGRAHAYKLISETLSPESHIPGVLKEALAVQKA